MKKSNEQVYEDEYQKIKQNLFNCLGKDNLDLDSDE
jgi:hypothetical protein